MALLERDTKRVARIGRGPSDNDGIVLRAYRGGVGEVLGKHAGGVALTASEVEDLGNGVARDAIKNLASEGVQHFSQRLLRLGVSFVDCITDELTAILLHLCRENGMRANSDLGSKSTRFEVVAKEG
jgi:hypothetical protein